MGRHNPIYINKSTAEAPISEMCKAIRQEKHITQNQLAELIGTNQTEVSFIERGFIPSATKIVAITNLYQKTLNYIKELKEQCQTK